MTRVICDGCKKQEAPTQYGLAPDGWFNVTERGNYNGGRNGQYDYCSRACAMQGLLDTAPAPVAQSPVSSTAAAEVPDGQANPTTAGH